MEGDRPVARIDLCLLAKSILPKIASAPNGLALVGQLWIATGRLSVSDHRRSDSGECCIPGRSLESSLHSHTRLSSNKAKGLDADKYSASELRCGETETHDCTPMRARGVGLDLSYLQRRV
jgi:hypothetical protein